MLGQRDCSEVISTHCSFRGPHFGFQPQCRAQNHLKLPHWGNQHPLPASPGIQTHSIEPQRHSHRYTHKNLKNKNKTLRAAVYKREPEPCSYFQLHLLRSKIPEKNAVSWGFATSTMNSATLYSKPTGIN